MPNANNDITRLGPISGNDISSNVEVSSQNRCQPQQGPAEVPAPPKRRPKRKESPGSSPKFKHHSRSQRSGANCSNHSNAQQQRSSALAHHQNRHGGGMNLGVSMGPADVTRNERTHNETNRTSPPTEGSNSGSDHLPDILNAHMPPPYSTLPQNTERSCRLGPPPPPPPLPPPAAPCGTLGKNF